MYFYRKSSSTSSVIGYTMNGNGSGMGPGSAMAQGPGSLPGNRPPPPGAVQGQRMPDPHGQMVLDLWNKMNMIKIIFMNVVSPNVKKYLIF